MTLRLYFFAPGGIWRRIPLLRIQRSLHTNFCTCTLYRCFRKEAELRSTRGSAHHVFRRAKGAEGRPVDGLGHPVGESAADLDYYSACSCERKR